MTGNLLDAGSNGTVNLLADDVLVIRAGGRMASVRVDVYEQGPVDLEKYSEIERSREKAETAERKLRERENADHVEAQKVADLIIETLAERLGFIR